MIDWLRRILHLGTEDEGIRQSDAVIKRTLRAVAEAKRENEGFVEDVVRAYPDTDLARALLWARDQEGIRA